MADTMPRVWGGDSETSIDQANQWMRAQPWYQQQMQAWGQDPGHPTLNKAQSKQIVRLAQANGAVVDEGHIEVDDHGNFNPIGHKLRNGLIIAGLAAGGILAAPAIAGALGASAAGGAGAGAAGAGAGAAGAGAAGAAIPALEGGATLAANLGGAGALGALGSGAATAAALGGGATLASNLGGAGALSSGAGTAGALGSSTIAPTAGTLATGGTGITSSGVGGSSVLGTLGRMGKNPQAYTDVGNALSQGAAGLASGRRADALANMQAAPFNLMAPSARTSQVARGDLLARMQNAAPTGDARIDKFAGGGLRPSAFGPDTQQAGNELKRQALLALMNQSDRINPSKAGTGENVMAGLGTAANIYGAVRGLY